ncbi:MAG: MltA domain-containing protein [Nitrospinota bacterium]|nr:MltA domain-containing protein [Nitrospinota bacterium]
MTRFKSASARLLAVALGLALMAEGCQSLFEPAPVKGYPMVRYTGPMPGFSDDMDPESLAQAAERSLEYLSIINPATEFQFGQRTVTAPQMASSIQRLVEIVRYEPDQKRRAYMIRNEFDVYKGAGFTDGGNVLITGYYQPVMNVRRQKDETFRYPLYKVPDDLVRVDLGLFSTELAGKRISGMVKNGMLEPYHDRRAIDGEGALEEKGLEIAWADDPFDVFILHIQGSGVLLYEDGEEKFANYASVNGHRYQSIGKKMIEEGKVPREKMSLQALRQWFRDNPQELERNLFVNPSYVFFRVMDEGPFGSLGRILVDGRSAAFDHSLFPKAAVAWFIADIPQAQDGMPAGVKREGRFVFNHDQGGAIKGPGRMDLFFGKGRDAEAAAGIMKNPGQLYFLLLKEKLILRAGR